MELGPRFDPRVSPFTLSLKDMASRRLPDIAVTPGESLVDDNVAVRSVTHFPITFTPKVTASV